MKKTTCFVMALALALGFTQCKKEQTPANNASEGVFITLNVGDGSRAVVTPGFTNVETGETYAKVEFEEDDVIYVGNNGAYCGYLEYNSENNGFAGTVTPTSTDDYLHFYFMGNKGAKSEPSSVSITDQSSKYPVISYGHSTVKYTSGTASYSATLQNYCAIVEFTSNEILPSTAITISGMKNTVEVHFDANNAATSTAGNPYSFSGEGDIILHPESNTSRWAILLPQTGLSNVKANAEGYDEAPVSFTVSEIKENDYLTESASFTLTEAASNIIYLADVTSNTTVGDGYTVTGTLGAEVKISIAAGATVTLDNASINANGDWTSGHYAGITCVGNATIILKDGSENTVRGFFEDYPGIYVPGNHTLTIKGGAAGTGKLTASPYDGGGTNDSYGAGIGGGYGTPCGNIKIQGGDINATGGMWAAGIGSGDNANCGTITISGGTVTATGGSDAAGIGSGSYASCDAITISGGTVKATGGYQAAGIGSGKEASCGDITITNGVTQVTATKGSYAPNSIGAGADGSCGTVTIEQGANVTQN